MVRPASEEVNGFRGLLGELVRWESQVGKENEHVAPERIHLAKLPKVTSFSRNGESLP